MAYVTRMVAGVPTRFVDNLDGTYSLDTAATATISAGDIQIGAVEVKNATDDTRATVGANGLYVDVRASALPTGAATVAAQTTGNTSVASVDTKLGEVQATPTSNTLLGRLKDLLTGIVLAAGSNIIGLVDSAARTVAISNVSLVSANTEYSLVLPATCRRLSFRTRASATVRLAFVSGKVATPVEPYLTVDPGLAYDSGPVKLEGATLYLAATSSGVIAEVEQWS